MNWKNLQRLSSLWTSRKNKRMKNKWRSNKTRKRGFSSKLTRKQKHPSKKRKYQSINTILRPRNQKLIRLSQCSLKTWLRRLRNSMTMKGSCLVTNTGTSSRSRKAKIRTPSRSSITLIINCVIKATKRSYFAIEVYTYLIWTIFWCFMPHRKSTGLSVTCSLIIKAGKEKVATFKLYVLELVGLLLPVMSK